MSGYLAAGCVLTGMYGIVVSLTIVTILENIISFVFLGISKASFIDPIPSLLWIQSIISISLSLLLILFLIARFVGLLHEFDIPNLALSYIITLFKLITIIANISILSLHFTSWNAISIILIVTTIIDIVIIFIVTFCTILFFCMCLK